MAPSQRMTLVVVPLLVLAGLGLVMYFGVGPARKLCCWARSFRRRSSRTPKLHCASGNFTQYHVEGQRIFVPKAEAARYNAALSPVSDVADSFGEDIAKPSPRQPAAWGPANLNRQDRVDWARRWN